MFLSFFSFFFLKSIFLSAVARPYTRICIYTDTISPLVSSLVFPLPPCFLFSPLYSRVHLQIKLQICSPRAFPPPFCINALSCFTYVSWYNLHCVLLQRKENRKSSNDFSTVANGESSKCVAWSGLAILLSTRFLF